MQHYLHSRVLNQLLLLKVFQEREVKTFQHIKTAHFRILKLAVSVYIDVFGFMCVFWPCVCVCVCGQIVYVGASFSS